MTVIILTDYHDGAKLRRSGELLDLPDAEARELIRKGIAIERKFGPEERKSSSGEGGV